MRNILTIRDIADLCGVSVATVSRVMNHKPDVSPRTRKQVEEVIDRCHFVGNASARDLKQTSHAVIGILVRGKSNPFLSSLSEALLSLTDRLPYDFVTEYIDEKDDEFEAALRLISQKPVIGLIFVGSDLNRSSLPVDEITVPTVFSTVSAADTCFNGASSVSVDDRRMAFDATTALLHRGHRHIAVFGATAESSGLFSDRYRGVCDAFDSFGLSAEPPLFRECRFSLKDGYQAARAFFAVHPEVTALFAMNDSIAAGALRALSDLGLRCPRDVSVIGYDGLEICDYLVPRLSTVVQPVREIASESVRLLLDMIEHQAAPTHVILDASLTLRESVRSLEES